MNTRHSIRFIMLSVLAASVAGAIGCSRSTRTAKSKDVTPPANIKESFVVPEGNEVAANATTPNGRSSLTIRKSSLEKEFLLSSNFVMLNPVRRFNGMKSRIVAFRQRGDVLIMLEASQGHVVDNAVPVDLVIAQFPILNENNDAIEFDFNAGMSELYMSTNWGASDDSGTAYDANEQFASSPLKNSFLRELRTVKTTNETQLSIVQVGQIPYRGSNISLETHYYLKPYLPSSTYKPAPVADFDKYGFFEITPILNQDGLDTVYSTRFDPEKTSTITFAVSANTPAEYRQAIKDGVLYWNQAFGYEKIKVIDAPAGVMAPNPEYNVVQWVNWDSAGMAYADAQMDPRTGEALHAQVFMTSVFAVSSRGRARALLRTLHDIKNHREPQIRLSGFTQARLCDRHDHSGVESLLEQANSENLTDERILEISKDYVREVVAHEIGHTLGLRHNFAGNLGGNLKASELATKYAKYTNFLEVDESLIPASSVMEYQEFPSAVLSGRKMVKNHAALPYDKAAIDILYHDQKPPADMPLFCTDSHADSFAPTCLRFDETVSNVQDAANDVAMNLARAPVNLIERMIRFKSPLKGQPVKHLSKMATDVPAMAKTMLSPRTQIITALMKETKDIRAHRALGVVDSLNEDVLIAKRIELLNSELSEIGGLAGAMPELQANMSEKWTAEFNALLEQPAYKSGVGYTGQTFEFSAEELVIAKEMAKKIFKRLERELVIADVNNLIDGISGTIMDTKLSDEYATILLVRAKKVVLETTGAFAHTTAVVAAGKSVEVDLPEFVYPTEIRKKAAGAFVSRKSESIVWGLDQHREMKAEFDVLTKKALGDNPISGAPVDGNQPIVAKWILENKPIASVLGQR
jgi:hypothetical protein